MVIAGGLVERGRKLDEALAIVAAEAMAFQCDLSELNHALGCTHPNVFQFQSNGERAVKSALMFSPFRLNDTAKFASGQSGRHWPPHSLNHHAPASDDQSSPARREPAAPPNCASCGMRCIC
jgi:hypothetical protein